MPSLRRRSVLALFLTLSISSPLVAAIKLVPIISGLTNPVMVVHAGDGSRRLFVVEQAGTIRVLQAGASTTSVFLDVRDRVLAGGERGLLGLAFHPLYTFNGRFFIYYTRRPDGAIVVAEYQTTLDRGCRQSQRDGAADDSASGERESQRRHARVRSGRLSLHRRRRRRIGQRPAEQRAEHRRAARKDSAVERG